METKQLTDLDYRAIGIATYLRELADKIENEKVDLLSLNATRSTFVDFDKEKTEQEGNGNACFSVSPHKVLLLTYSEVGGPSALNRTESPGEISILPSSETL